MPAPSIWRRSMLTLPSGMSASTSSIRSGLSIRRSIENVKAKSLIHRVHTKGNTGTLFTHETDEEGMEASSAEAARLLITSRLFHTCGPGPSIDGKKAYFKNSPYANGVIFWAQGETMYDILPPESHVARR